MAQILVADDEAKLARVIAEMLEAMGHSVDCVFGGKAALDRIGTQPPDIVITDLRMPDVDGMIVLREVRARAPATDVVMRSYAAKSSRSCWAVATPAWCGP